MADTVTESLLKRFIPLYMPETSLSIQFFGGEPLLEKETILHMLEKTSRLLQKPQLKYVMTTNGAHLDADILKTIQSHPFDVVISHDGLWQQQTRPGIPAHMTLAHFEALLTLFPTIPARYNCICPPSQIDRLTDNILHFRAMTSRPVHFGLDSISPWDEEALSKLDRELTLIREKGLVDACPTFFTPPKPGQFTCSSETRLTIDPEGYIWGCHQFYDLFQQQPGCGSLTRHRVGHVDMPQGDLKSLLADWPACEGYEQRQFLAGDEACLVCDQFRFCAQCPVNGAYTTHVLQRLPPWVCGIQKVLQKHRTETKPPRISFPRPLRPHPAAD